MFKLLTIQIIIIFILSCTNLAQSKPESNLPDHAPETVAFIKQREAEIQRELVLSPRGSATGYYEAFNPESGFGWVLMWAPKAGFIAYMYPDVSTPAQVCTGAVKYQGKTLILMPENKIREDLELVIKTQFRVISYGKHHFLIPPSQIKEFNQNNNDFRHTKGRRYREWMALYLLREPVRAP